MNLSTDDRGRTNRRRRGFAVVFLLFVVAHLAKVAAFIAAGQGSLQGDALVYWSLGQRIVGGDSLLLGDPPEVARTPGYPYFVAFFQSTCGRWALAATIAAQHLLLLANVVLACWICWRLTEKRAAVLLCLALSLSCFSCHGVAVYLLSDSLLSFLLTLCIALAIAWRHAPSPLWSLALGLALGGAILTKPVVQFGGLILCGWMLASRSDGLSLRRCAAHCGLVIAIALIIVAPWLIRNEVHFGSPFLTKIGGRALWLTCFRGNPADPVDPTIPFADGPATQTIRRTVSTVSLHDTWGVSRELVRLGYSEIEADDLLMRGAKEAILANPWKFFLSRCRRYGWFWLTPNECFRPNTTSFRFSASRPDWPGRNLATPDESNENVEGQSTWRADWYFKQGRLNFLWHPHPAIYALAVVACAAALIVLAIAPKTRGVALLFALWLGYFSAVTALVAFPVYRYRMILEPVMIVAVVSALTMAYEWYLRKRRRHTADVKE
jgi:4-amino-4-deoxy-L-arabinose transferase-like glycosyltransferase